MVEQTSKRSNVALLRTDSDGKEKKMEQEDDEEEEKEEKEMMKRGL